MISAGSRCLWERKSQGEGTSGKQQRGGQGCEFHASHGVPGRQSFDKNDTCSLPYGTRPAARASRGPTAVQPGGDEPMHGRRRQKESHSMLMNHDLWDSATPFLHVR